MVSFVRLSRLVSNRSVASLRAILRSRPAKRKTEPKEGKKVPFFTIAILSHLDEIKNGLTHVGRIIVDIKDIILTLVPYV